MGITGVHRFWLRVSAFAFLASCFWLRASVSVLLPSRFCLRVPFRIRLDVQSRALVGILRSRTHIALLRSAMHLQLLHISALRFRARIAFPRIASGFALLASHFWLRASAFARSCFRFCRSLPRSRSAPSTALTVRSVRSVLSENPATAKSFQKLSKASRSSELHGLSAKAILCTRRLYGFKRGRGRSFPALTASYGIRRRLTLPGRCQPSTISAERLNFCVRDGNRWIPLAITTGN